MMPREAIAGLFTLGSVSTMGGRDALGPGKTPSSMIVGPRPGDPLVATAHKKDFASERSPGEKQAQPKTMFYDGAIGVKPLFLNYY